MGKQTVLWFIGVSDRCEVPVDALRAPRDRRFRVIHRPFAKLVLLLSGVFLVGCINSAPSTARAPVPSASNRDAARENDYVKPMPADDWRDAPRNAQPPEPRQ
jgi:hypothetical protein